MVDFWEWVSPILVVAIPTAIGGVASFFGIHWWQIKKEKFELKSKRFELRRNIQKLFQQSIVARMTLTARFMSEIRETLSKGYGFVPVGQKFLEKTGEIIILEEDEKDTELGSRVSFPTKKEEFPQYLHVEAMKVL